MGQKAVWAFHWGIVLVGSFLTVAGAYAMATSLIDAYTEGLIDELRHINMVNAL